LIRGKISPGQKGNGGKTPGKVECQYIRRPVLVTEQPDFPAAHKKRNQKSVRLIAGNLLKHILEKWISNQFIRRCGSLNV
jgi:hypothetical protein